MFAGLKHILFGSRASSKSMAKSRLHFVLVQDRTGLSADDLARFKREMVGVIERYFVVDKHAFDISYKREGDITTLVINSPVVVKRQEAMHHEAGVRKLRRRKRRRLEPPLPPPIPAASNT